MRRRHQSGSAVLYTIILSPVIVLTLGLVVEVGSLQLVKQRLSSAADMATVDAASQAATANSVGHLDTAVAIQAARQALADNLLPLSQQIAGTDAVTLANNANVIVITTVPANDPLQPGRVLTAPTIETQFMVPVHSGLLAAAGLPTVMTMTISSTAAVREAGQT